MPETSDAYTEFALIYDEWQALFPQPFALALSPYVLKAARSAPEASLADLACGTGTFVHWWSATQRNWDIWGVDGSPAMIRVARRARKGLVARHLPAGTQSVLGSSRLLVQDLTRLALPRPVGLATCLFDSLNHVTRSRDLTRIFRRAAQNLLPGGIFVFDLVDEIEFDEIFTGGSVLEGEDLYVGIESEIFRQRGASMGHAIFNFFSRVGRSNRWKKLRAVIVERCWTRKEIERLLEGTGLEMISVERISPEDVEGVFVPRSFWTCRRAL